MYKRTQGEAILKNGSEESWKKKREGKEPEAEGRRNTSGYRQCVGQIQFSLFSYSLFNRLIRTSTYRTRMYSCDEGEIEKKIRAPIRLIGKEKRIDARNVTQI